LSSPKVPAGAPIALTSITASKSRFAFMVKAFHVVGRGQRRERRAQAVCIAYPRTAASFNNPDHVSIVIHHYRWRLSLAEGEPRYDIWNGNCSKVPVSPCLQSPLPVIATVRPLMERRIVARARANMRTASSRASAPMCPRKLPKPLPTPWSTSTAPDRGRRGRCRMDLRSHA